MNLEKMVANRKTAYDQKDYKESDRLRDLLDANGIFCFDLKCGFHEVYYYPKGTMTRKLLIKKMQDDRQAEMRMNSWIYSMNNG